jgi:hypothetical protein
MVSGVWSNLNVGQGLQPPPTGIVPKTFGRILRSRGQGIYQWRAPLNSAVVSQVFTITDTVVGDDTHDPNIVFDMFDAGAGVDAIVSSTTVVPNVADSGVGVEALLVSTAFITVADAGAGIDAAPSDQGLGPTGFQVPWNIISRRPKLFMWFNQSATFITFPADVGTFVDSVDVANTAVSVADAGAGTDAADVIQQALITVLDSAFSLDDMLPIPVDAPIADAASVNEVLVFETIVFPLGDTGVGTDVAVVVGTQLVNVIDDMLGTDVIATLAPLQITLSDFGVGVDEFDANVKELFFPDFGTGFDRVSVQGPISAVFGTQRWWILQAQRRVWTLQ